MGFRKLEDIADDIVVVLKGTNAFNSVTWAAVDNYRQLLKHASNIAGTPKAVVCIGGGDWRQRGTVRRFTVAVIVFSPFKAGTARKAGSVWSLAEAAAGPFLPEFSSLNPPVFPEINGVKYELQNWSPLETDDRTASFIIELEAVETYKLETGGEE